MSTFVEPKLIKDYKGDEAEVLYAREYLKGLFPDEQVYEYMVSVLSDTIFEPTKGTGNIYVWKGDGNNGKTSLCFLMSHVLGTACKVFLKSGNTSGLDENTLFAYMDDCTPLNPEILKKLVSSDEILVKRLYEEPKHIKPKFKLNILTNSSDKIQWGDDADLWNRIKVIPFDSTFPSIEGGNVPEVQPFLWLLKEQQKKNLNGSADVPERIVLETAKYRQEHACSL